MHSGHVFAVVMEVSFDEMVTLPSFLGGRGVRSHREVQEIPAGGNKGKFCLCEDHFIPVKPKCVLFFLTYRLSCFTVFSSFSLGTILTLK